MEFFRLTWAVLRRELGRIKKYPVFSTMAVILPVLSFVFFILLFQKGTPLDIPIAVLDQDKTSLSRTVTSMIDATQACSVDYEISDMAEGERMMKQGLIEAVIYIPRGFEKDISSNTRTTVAAYINGLNISAGSLVHRDVQTAMTTFSTGIQLQLLMKQGLSEKEAMVQAMPISMDKHLLFNPYTNYGYYLVPSFLPMMLLIFVIMTSIFTIGSELRAGTAGEWFATAGNRTMPALIGKMFPITNLFFLMSMFMNLILYKWIGVPYNGSMAMIIIGGFLLVLAYQSLGILIISVLSNMRLSLSIGGGYSVLAFTFSGLTFPLMAMTPFVRMFAYIFPFTFYTNIFIDQALRGAPVIYSVHEAALMCIFIIVPLLCLPRLKKISTNEKYWRRL